VQAKVRGGSPGGRSETKGGRISRSQAVGKVHYMGTPSSPWTRNTGGKIVIIS